MAASTRAQVLSLYRMMLKESKKFPSYNYRTYAVRRVRDAFKANRKVKDPKAVVELMENGQQMLALIQRQTSIGRMYEAQKTVVE
ncbi:LYR motif-containing protein 4 [Austrofundulus limnaeus]|uniref:LYR motif-containing protein 4 n=1 Tax=Austrofundulus limnaeus TaxID=52670 RepID=A0A2I4CYP2_AUSLI|nr:PREDICTED: LYR motif-containing protein 4 [Austrofundulus limnaeus]